MAYDGVAAMQKLAAIGACDVILLGRAMESMDGIQVLKALKADARYCDIPVIMQAVDDTARRVLEAMRAGACDYIVKPYTDERILSAVKKSLLKAGKQEDTHSMQPDYPYPALPGPRILRKSE